MSRSTGETAFDGFYRALFGGRWPALKRALQSDPRYTAVEYPGRPAYYLDEASMLAAEAARVVPGLEVLDLCAAPGGKSLVLAGRLAGSGSLVANERSRARRERLRRVLDAHLPEKLKSVVRVTGHDARRWLLHEVEAYDTILLDAPCSAERHLLARPRELAKWTPSRTKRLAAQSYCMLASALEVVRPGGLILYCTCTVSPTENDEVIGRLLHRRSGRVEVLRPQLDTGEPTRWGVRILPDVSDGHGPLYVGLLRRCGSRFVRPN